MDPSVLGTGQLVLSKASAALQPFRSSFRSRRAVPRRVLRRSAAVASFRA